MQYFYTFYYKPTVYDSIPYTDGNKLYFFDNINEAKKELNIIKMRLEESLKPISKQQTIIEKLLNKPKKVVYVVLTEEGKLIKNALETLHIQKVVLNKEINWTDIK